MNTDKTIRQEDNKKDFVLGFGLEVFSFVLLIRVHPCSSVAKSEPRANGDRVEAGRPFAATLCCAKLKVAGRSRW